MKQRLAWCLVLVLVISMVSMGCSGGGNGASSGDIEEPQKQTEADPMKVHLKMMTGSSGGVWFPTGSVIAEFLKKDYPGLQITLTPGGGVSNIEAIQQGATDLGFGKACSTVDGFEGRPPFTEKTVKATEVAFLDEEIFQIIVPANSPIKSVADIKGKILTTAQKGNTTEVMVQQLLALYELSYDDLKQVHFVSFNDSAGQMKDGKADVFMVSTSLPAASVLDLASTRDIKILSIEPEIVDKMHELNRGYIKKTVPAGSYDFQEEEITTLATGLHLAASSDLSEEVVYNITKSIAENVDEIVAVHEMYKTLTRERLATDIGVPFHPGALKYYQEQGLIK